MIVRIYQIDIAKLEANAGWPDTGLTGAIRYTWPAGTNAFEILILETDENSNPLPESFRQTQMRQLIPELLDALHDSDEQTIVRLDGPLARGEILDALQYMTDAQGHGRFALSKTRQDISDGPAPLTSARFVSMQANVKSLCADEHVGLERGVRLRAFGVPDPLVDSLLELENPADGVWGHILPHAGFAISTARKLAAVQVTSQRLGVEEMKKRLMERLLVKTEP